MSASDPEYSPDSLFKEVRFTLETDRLNPFKWAPNFTPSGGGGGGESYDDKSNATNRAEYVYAAIHVSPADR